MTVLAAFCPLQLAGGDPRLHEERLSLPKVCQGAPLQDLEHLSTHLSSCVTVFVLIYFFFWSSVLQPAWGDGTDAALWVDIEAQLLAAGTGGK